MILFVGEETAGADECLKGAEGFQKGRLVIDNLQNGKPRSPTLQGTT